jgi:hypothetical protein
MASETPVHTTTAPVPNAATRPRLLHVHATADGESHLQELTVSPDAGLLPLAGLTARSYNPSEVAWHVAPQRQFAINLTGELEVEVSDGARRRIGPGDLVLLEDTYGKGHVTRLLSPVTCLFLRVEGDFDVEAWAAGATG